MNNQIQQVMDILQEECAEVIQMVSKIRRFGLDEQHLKNGETNRYLLTEEIGDLMCCIDILVDNGVIDQTEIKIAKEKKIEKLKKWSTIYEKD
jgi:hypothetical protein